MAAPSSARSLELLVDPALVRITSDEGTTLGTGFVAAPGGGILTCHHVVAASRSVVIHYADGVRATVDAASIVPFPEVDLAIVPVPAQDRPPLPLAPGGHRPDSFWTKGFQLQDRGFAGPVPARGEVTGDTLITYAHGEHEYRLQVLVLSQGELNRGLSGAPLIDPASGSVYGLIVAHLPNTTDIRGFALVLGEAAGLAPGIEELLRLNDRFSPRFGRRINRLGAHVLCQAQVRKTLARLEQDGLFLPDLLCEREALSRYAEAFARDSAPFMAIHGPAGAGKTSWLARYAADLSAQQPALLVRGQAIDPGSPSIETLADLALVGADQEPWREPPKAADVALALQATGGSLWLLLDALNESRMKLGDLADIWIPETLDWIRRNGARLVLTCRTDDWQLLSSRFPSASVYQPETETRSDAGRLPGLSVGTFSPEEAAAALKLYGLDEHVDAEVLRHPLAMRLTWELAREGPGELPRRQRRPELGQVIDRFVDRQSQRVALAIGAPAHPAPIRAVIERLAAHLLDGRTQEVDFETVDARFGHAREWLEHLAREHLLVVTPSGYRFSFDEVGEYLQSVHVTAEMLAEGSPLWEASPQDMAVPLGVLVHAFGRLAGGSDTAGLASAVAGLCQWLRSLPNYYFAFDVARRLAVHQGTAPLIEEIVQACAAIDTEVAHTLYLSEAEQLALPVAASLRLVQRLLPAEDWYGWRAKDWQDPRRRRADRGVFEYGGSLAHVVGGAFKEDASQTIRTLFEWITDPTKLEGRGASEATVGDFALACLFHGRQWGLVQMVESTTQPWRPITQGLLSALAETETAASRSTPRLRTDLTV